MNDQDTKRQFLAWLPWYVNGTLDAGKREWVDQYLNDHPDAVSELRWEESQRDAIRENQPAVSPDIGWAAFQVRIGERQRTDSTGWGARWKQWFADFQGGRTWSQRPAAICLALAMLITQGGIIGALLFQRDEVDMNPAISRGWTPPTAAHPVLRLRFKPETPERELRQLLIGIDVMIIAGPSQLGDYIVSVDADQLNEAKKMLAASKWVEAADILPNPPNIQ